MRQLSDYPSEWLAGVNGGDAGLDRVCSWFKQAGYETVVVLDGDCPGTLSSLSAEGIGFLALPKDKKLEHIVSDALVGMEEGPAAQVLLSAIGFSGEINWHNEFPTIWPALAGLFREKGLERKALPTNVALAEISGAASRIGGSQFPGDLQRVLVLKKSRRAYETIASCLHQKGAIPAICSKVLEALREIWNDQRSPGQYQFDDSGSIQNYTV